MSGVRSDNTSLDRRREEEDEEMEEGDEEVSDNPLPIWMEGDSLAPPCQAGMDVVRAIIEFASVAEDDVLYDLGCGDGRICIEAAESRGARACGVEIEKDLADKFRGRVAAKGLESKVTVVHGDLRDLDLSDATVVVIYLLPDAVAGLVESHLLPLLRRGKCTPPVPPEQHTVPPTSTEQCPVGVRGGGTSLAYGRAGDAAESPPRETGGIQGIAVGDPVRGNEVLDARKLGQEVDQGRRSISSGSGGCVSGGRARGSCRPCRIVCNTWGIPGATAVREAGIGLHGGVKLRLYTHESLPPGGD